MMSVIRLRVVCAAILLTAAGCSGDQKAFPVRGQLSFEGKPMAGALIIFHSADPSQKLLVMARANAEGVYELSTSGTPGGAPPGEYKVTITWEEFARPGTEDNPNTPGTGKDRLRGAYAGVDKTLLRATVERKDNTIDFKLP